MCAQVLCSWGSAVYESEMLHMHKECRLAALLNKLAIRCYSCDLSSEDIFAILGGVLYFELRKLL